jgi:hypothetical protein
VDFHPQPIYTALPVGCAHMFPYISSGFECQLARLTFEEPSFVFVDVNPMVKQLSIPSEMAGIAISKRTLHSFLGEQGSLILLLKIFNFLFVLFEAKLELHDYINPSR